MKTKAYKIKKQKEKPKRMMTVAQAITWVPDSEKIKMWNENAEVIIKALDLHFVEHIPEDNPKQKKKKRYQSPEQKQFGSLERNYEMFKALGLSKEQCYIAVIKMWSRQETEEAYYI